MSQTPNAPGACLACGVVDTAALATGHWPLACRTCGSRQGHSLAFLWRGPAAVARIQAAARRGAPAPRAGVG